MPIPENQVRWAEAPKIGFFERLYLPAIGQGLRRYDAAARAIG